MSEKIQIQRGCRQGDPISPYLFIIGAEILAKLIKINPEIIGIKIMGNEFKLTQFAEDTTLMLDGSQHSQQTALNVLEVFGDFSGLRMNREKTKVIWIGRKRFSKEKLNVQGNLNWGNINFNLLGIEFTTNLNEISSKNYAKALNNIQKEIKKWRVRHLTPIGKIVLIKTLFIPKCVHMLTSIERSDTFLKYLNKLLYSFIWSGGPDKIKRVTINSKYMQGGLKMTNLCNFEKALKVSWVRKLYTHQNLQWFRLLYALYNNIDKVLVFGDLWCSQFLKKISNPFWQNILFEWSDLCKRQEITNNTDLLQSCIWYNSKISKNPIYFPDWFNHGIYYVRDLLDAEGKMLTYKHLKMKYNCSLNILNYLTVRLEIMKYLSGKNISCSTSFGPMYPSHMNLIIQSRQGCKKYYELYNAQLNDVKPLCEFIWDSMLKKEYTECKDLWPLIYKICFNCIQDNEYSWFQYRILFKILGMKDYLKKVKIAENNECGLCKTSVESIDHLFSKCEKANVLWENIKIWIQNKVAINFNITDSMKILGYLTYDKNFWPLNLILLVTRKYLYWCSRNDFKINIYYLQKEMKKMFIEQKCLNEIKYQNREFSKKWAVWQNLFTGIGI